MDVRATPGGPSPAEVLRAIADAEVVLDRDTAWIEGTVARLRAAEEKLKQAAAAL